MASKREFPNYNKHPTFLSRECGVFSVFEWNYAMRIITARVRANIAIKCIAMVK